MRLGIIADVHANADALTAILADERSVDWWVCAGDAVGYYDRPNETCELLRRLDAPMVRGNHDAYVTGRLPPDAQRAAAYRTEWTRSVLHRDHLRWLSALPIEQTFELDGTKLRLRHASPWDEETYLYPDSALLDEIDLEEREVLVVAHTHRPLDVVRGRGRVVNPGSVGQPRDRVPGAAYAVIDTVSGEVTHHRVPYDIAAVQRRLQSQGWDERVVSILSRTG